MRITSEEIKHIAALSRIAMSTHEVEMMRDQMSQILESFDILQQIETENVVPTGHSIDLDTVTRIDEVTISSPVDDILANAPDTENDFIRIRSVLNE